MSNELGKFRRELRSCIGRPVAYQVRDGAGSALVPLLDRVARGERIHDGDLYAAVVETAAEDRDARKELAQQLAAPTIVPAGKGGKATALVSMRGVALYDVEYQPFAFSTALLAQTMTMLGADPQIGMIVLQVDSPGGVVTGVQEAADAIYAARQKKPVVAIVNPLCASAAYWLASQATEIVSVPSGDIGSVGVFILHAECSKMMEDAGIKPTFIFAKDSPYKVDGNAYEPLSETALEEFQTGVDEVMADFVKAISRGRGVPASKVIADFGKGRTLDAKKAKAAGMIDRVATVNVALARLGLAPSSTDDESRRRRGEKVESISISWRDDDTGTGGCARFVDHAWPQRAAFTKDMIEDGGARSLIVEGDDVTISVANGSATYRKVDENETGDWICQLIESEYTPAPEPEPEPEAAAVLTPENIDAAADKIRRQFDEAETDRFRDRAAARMRNLFILENS